MRPERLWGKDSWNRWDWGKVKGRGSDKWWERGWGQWCCGVCKMRWIGDTCIFVFFFVFRFSWAAARVESTHEVFVIVIVVVYPMVRDVLAVCCSGSARRYVYNGWSRSASVTTAAIAASFPASAAAYTGLLVTRSTDARCPPHDTAVLGTPRVRSSFRLAYDRNLVDWTRLYSSARFTFTLGDFNFWLSLSLSLSLSETLSWTLKSGFRTKFNLTSV